MRRNSKVRLINDERLKELGLTRIGIGAEGVIVATRPRIDDQVLVKFKGLGGKLSMDPTHLEEL